MNIVKPPLGALSLFGHPLSRGLVGLWPFNEGSGTFVNDMSGNGNTGTFIGTPVWVAGPNGLELDLEGTSSQISLANTIALTYPYTIIVDLHPDNSGDMFLGDNTTASFLWFSNATILNIRNTDSSADSFTIADCRTRSMWAVVSKTNLFTGMDIYRDGNYIVSGDNNLDHTNININRIGNGYNSDAFVFDGQIGFVSIYNRALSASEIAQLYREPFCMFEGDPIELWSAATLGGAPPVGNAGIMTPWGGYWGPTY